MAAAVDRSLYAWSSVPQGDAEVGLYVETAQSWWDAGNAVPFAIVRVADGAVIGSTRFLSRIGQLPARLGTLLTSGLRVASREATPEPAASHDADTVQIRPGSVSYREEQSDPGAAVLPVTRSSSLLACALACRQVGSPSNES